MRILLWGDGPTTTTGFGRVNREILKSLWNAGHHDITALCINYFGISPDNNKKSQSDIDIRHAYENYNLIPCLLGRASQDPYGRQFFIKLISEEKWDLVIIHNDLFNLAPLTPTIIKVKQQNPFKLITYFPIDNDNFDDRDINALYMGDMNITYNNWSIEQVKKKLNKIPQQAIRDKVEKSLSAIYLGYNPKDFYTINEEEKKAFRKKFFGDKVNQDDILLVRSDSNTDRKDWFRTLQIVGKVAEKNNKIKLYANTEITSPDFPLYNISEKCGLTPGKNFLYLSTFTKANGLNQDYLNKLYNCADIGITTSRGEGCGLFHYEMMALGKPCLISNNSAHTEAIEAGACIPINCGTTLQEHELAQKDNGVIRPTCNIEHGIQQLEIALSEAHDGEKALDFMKDKTWDEIGKQWADKVKRAMEEKTLDILKTSK